MLTFSAGLNMSKRKSLSVEEKSTKLLELFHETGDVFQLKDLERLAPKEKGIVQQSVKSVLQELVDDGRVCSEKIAGSLYYWSFPGEALLAAKRKLQENETLVAELQSKIAKAERQLSSAKSAQSDADAVAKIEREMSELQQEKAELEKRLTAMTSDFDCEQIANKEKDAKRVLEAANRWTDNIFNIKSWCKRKFDKEDRELNKAFGIPEDLDYLEDAK